MQFRLASKPADVNAKAHVVDQATVVSFDVFDTLIVRRFVTQESLLREVSYTIEKSGTCSLPASVVYSLRLDAEKKCRDSSPTQEVTLNQITCEMVKFLGLTDSFAPTLSSIEESVELSVGCANPNLLKLAWRRYEEGKRIIYLTDTYHSSDFIRQLLGSCGFPIEGTTIYASGELKLSKGRGDIFPAIVEVEGSDPSKIVHIGNHPRADFTNARHAGINSALVELANPTQYELDLDATSKFRTEFGAKISGASRMSRIVFSGDGESKGELTDIAADLVAPTFVPFVMWILAQSRRQRLKRLYFLSRDGKLLAAIANELCKLSEENSPEIRYIVGGRACYYPIAIVEGGPQANSTALRDLATTSLQNLGDELGIPRGWAKNIPSINRLGIADDARIASRANDVYAALSNDPAWSLLLSQSQSERARLAKAYLAAQGVIGSDPVGIVDIGWAGRTCSAIDAAVHADGAAPPSYFFFGLTTAAEDVCPRSSIAYFADHRFPSHRARSLYIGALETLCSSGEPRTLGFEIRDGLASPKYMRDEYSQRHEGYANKIEEVVLDVVRQLGKTSRPDDFTEVELQDPSFLAALERNLSSFWERPSLDEAETWSKVAHSSSVLEVAVPIGRRIFPIELLRLRSPNVIWLAGSLRLSSPIVRQALMRRMAVERSVSRLLSLRDSRLGCWQQLKFIGLKRLRKIAGRRAGR
jgi:FMN phosphatase YigB (HAD superfamily)